MDMYVLVGVICFFAGSAFGLITCSLLVAAGRADDASEFWELRKKNK